MQRTMLLAVLTIVLCVGLVGVGWAEKIAFVIPERFVSGLDNPPAEVDVPFVWESLEIGDPAGGLPELGILALAQRLVDQGHTITFYGSDSDDYVSVIEDNDLIFLAEAIGSSSVCTGDFCDYYESPKPVITNESYILDNMFMAANVAFTGGAHSNKLKVVDPDHPITQGLPESFFYTIDDPATGNPAIVTLGTILDEANLFEVGKILVRIDGPGPSGDDPDTQDDAPAVIVVDEGELSDLGDPFQARFVFIAYSDVVPDPADHPDANPDMKTLAVLNDVGWQLWDNAFNWALGKEAPVQVEEWEIH